ncbi:hypothetical protein CGRA01v4_13509 [Colletotrichum graminicola]|uniref:RNA helicase HEL117 n=1 Tax=Colletotrichum graminicola (strain M1.001 / M2 / FGSC 10212) TaxID=645133 RepID=E3QRT4_COLGM|nr:uncharacterized protein GLRG_08851 [Colletotrichum graminicola M1.001]EFQ33572.1 hypothetical protein GLRG_08851 [Colletotrichum graminicola M1.001]WDK22219.1 hypothetical protein CGRA01v4_13509 [Colletotrichum graminicola]
MPMDERSGERRNAERQHRRTRSRSVTRTRSRSPRRHRDEGRRRSPIGDDDGGSHRERRRSPRSEDRDRESRHHHRHHHHHHRHRHRGDKDKDRSNKTAAAVEPLPYEARQLSKSELGVFRPLLAYYLDLQKQKDIRDMDEREVRGRWKSFVGKWNRGELSQGWYDPEMFVAAKERAIEEGIDGPREEVRRDDVEVVKEQRHDGWRGEEDEEGEEEDDDDDLGPRLPPTAREGGQRAGPGIPSMADLSLHRETLAEEAQLEREARAADLRQQRKDDRRLQRERLDEVAPRAEAGTRERQLEKRALVNDKMKEFRDKGGDGGVPEVGEQELMGGGDSLQEFKAMKAREERKKTERELRREEIARAREAEREARVREYREREEGVMKGLRELAKQRFG